MTPRGPVVVEVDVDGRTNTTSPLPAARAQALWHEQRALGRPVRILPHAFGERPPWVRDGQLVSVDYGRVERERVV